MKAHKRLVSIITVTFNGLHFLKKMLLTVEKQTYKNIEIIIVDNNSTDDTVTYLRKYYPKIKVIENEENNGFAKANNQGARIAKGKYIFLLNNDTELYADAIVQLINCYEEKSILTSYQIPARNKKLQGRAGAGMDIFGYPFVNHENLDKTKLFYADGACFFMAKNDFFDIGMFDGQLFMFYEEVDLCWRAQLMGYKIIPCRESKLYHYYGGTAKIKLSEQNKYITSYFRRFLNEKNAIRNLIKNYSLPLVTILLPILLFFHSIEMLVFILSGDIEAALCYLKAYWWNFFCIGDTLKYRKMVQSKRIISDFELMKRMYWKYSKFDLFLKLGLPKFEN